MSIAILHVIFVSFHYDFTNLLGSLADRYFLPLPPLPEAGSEGDFPEVPPPPEFLRN